jgi:uncharacterized membrane protein HdeD (DUF308 family)
MTNFLKRVKANALFSAGLYVLLGLVLLVWPEWSTEALCMVLGLVLVLCGLSDVFKFLRNRDGTLYAAMHLLTGVVLSAVGIWLMVRPTLVAVIIPRIIGVLICFHGLGNLGDTLQLRRGHSPCWKTAALLGAVTLVLGIILVLSPFQAFTTAVRIIGVVLLYDGISNIWITLQVSRFLKAAEKVSNDLRDAADAEYRDLSDE